MQLRRLAGGVGGVVAELGCHHHHLGVSWALVVDAAAFLSVVGAGALVVCRIVHPQQGLIHQALAVGADGAGPVAPTAMQVRPSRIQRLRAWGEAIADGGGPQGMSRCPPQAAERARESVDARIPTVIVQAYYAVFGLEGRAVPDREA
jgi:hypothetical protein